MPEQFRPGVCPAADCPREEGDVRKSLRRSIGPPSPSMVVALVALFVALGGSAFAVSQVGTKQLKNAAVTTAKIRNGAVNNAKLGNGSVTGA